VSVVDGNITLYTDSRYADRAPAELAQVNSSAEVVIAVAELAAEVRSALGAASIVGLEADHVSWSRQQLIDATWLPDADVQPTTAVVDSLRAIKDDAEVARISRAASIVDHALADVLPHLSAGLTERQFAATLEQAIRSGGADDIGFDTIVASGPNGAIPHHAPGDRTIVAGDLVIVDVGGRVDGYRSDMTRTFCIGEMTADQQRHYDTVIAAQQAGVEAMNEGALTSAVDAAARAVIDLAGWGDSFTHGTGHGVGIDIHELPRVAKDAQDRYELGTVATVEPGVYLQAVGGVRIEDTCVVTEAGALRLTGFPKDLAVVG